MTASTFWTISEQIQFTKDLKPIKNRNRPNLIKTVTNLPSF
jgi:hypothetical protein